MTTEALPRAMPSARRPTWPYAVWVGAIDLADLAGREGGELALADPDGHASARLLVRDGTEVRGFVESPIIAGAVPLAPLRALAEALPRPPAPASEGDPGGPFTVVVCTRDRPEQLRAALRSVLAVDHPSFDVVVVDNASATDETARLVQGEFAGRVRLVREPTPGLASARNAGLQAAMGRFVAYTDDDVLVDPGWLRGLARGFAAADDVVCVCGLVPSGELRTPVQAYFDDRVYWSRAVRRRVYAMRTPPADAPLFPFSVGDFGTGANIAVDRAAWLALGGFDTAFGVGTPTGGGEDLDLFLRVLVAGRTLVVEPSALVWHRHRADLAGLRRQTRGYGRGLGAWLTKIAVRPGTAALAARRAPGALTRLLAKRDPASVGVRVPGVPAPFPPEALAPIAAATRRLARYELLCVLTGPVHYLRRRLRGAGTLHRRR